MLKRSEGLRNKIKILFSLVLLGPTLILSLVEILWLRVELKNNCSCRYLYTNVIGVQKKFRRFSKEYPIPTLFSEVNSYHLKLTLAG